MQPILDWADHNAAWLFVAVVAIAVVAGLAYWRQRPAWQAEPPIALLHTRTASLIAALTASLFALLAVAIEADGRLVAFDQRVTDRFRAELGPQALDLLAALTHLGDSHALVIASAVVAVVLLVIRHRLLAVAWCLALLGNGLLIRIGKDYFQRTRPIHEHGIVVETGYSFPSGHAAGSLAFYGLLAYVLATLLPPRWNKALLIAAILVVAIIGASRVLLQVHFVSDVFAGYALGTGWLAVCIAAIEFLRTSRQAPPMVGN